MGVHANITWNAWPEQGTYEGERVRVCFHYEAEHELLGTVVRDDNTAPGITIIELDDGRHVLGTECQWYGAAPLGTPRSKVTALTGPESLTTAMLMGVPVEYRFHPWGPWLQPTPMMVATVELAAARWLAEGLTFRVVER